MLKVENITKYYGDFLAVDNLSFEINEETCRTKNIRRISIK